MTQRIGIGHDTHRLTPGRPLVLGGLTIPHESGPDAHSDGDVLLHALIDAILGALAWGDIGEWFPDTAAEFHNVASARLLEPVRARLQTEGWRVVNIDSIIFAQRPKLSPWKEPIRAHLADLLHIPLDCVSVKAKTGERVGPIGREEALCAEVVVLLERDSM